jgi:hypothetical protein
MNDYFCLRSLQIWVDTLYLTIVFHRATPLRRVQASLREIGRAGPDQGHREAVNGFRNQVHVKARRP